LGRVNARPTGRCRGSPRRRGKARDDGGPKHLTSPPQGRAHTAAPPTRRPTTAQEGPQEGPGRVPAGAGWRGAPARAPQQTREGWGASVPPAATARCAQRTEPRSGGADSPPRRPGAPRPPGHRLARDGKSWAIYAPAGTGGPNGAVTREHQVARPLIGGKRGLTAEPARPERPQDDTRSRRRPPDPRERAAAGRRPPGPGTGPLEPRPADGAAVGPDTRPGEAAGGVASRAERWRRRRTAAARRGGSAARGLLEETEGPAVGCTAGNV
jgi:hypothetical protein